VISRSFAFSLQVGASSQISALFSSGERDAVAQVFSDLLRLTLLCAIVIPGAFISLTKPTVRWFGADEALVSLGCDYILPNLAGGFVPCLFLFLFGCLQAEGRSWVFGLVQIIAMTSNMLAFTSNPVAIGFLPAASFAAGEKGTEG
jgi:Na+-driven multidrug efflux pump